MVFANSAIGDELVESRSVATGNLAKIAHRGRGYAPECASTGKWHFVPRDDDFALCTARRVLLKNFPAKPFSFFKKNWGKALCAFAGVWGR